MKKAIALLGAAILLALGACAPADAAHMPGVPFACELTLDAAKAKVAAFHPVTTWEVVKGKPFDAVVAHFAKEGWDLSTTTMMIVTHVEGIDRVFIAFTSSEDCVNEDWLWNLQVEVYNSLVGVPL